MVEAREAEPYSWHETLVSMCAICVDSRTTHMLADQTTIGDLAPNIVPPYIHSREEMNMKQEHYDSTSWWPVGLLLWACAGSV